MSGNSSPSPSSTSTTVTRLPTRTDPDIIAASNRAKRNARDRTGRQSTILSDALRNLTRSHGNLGG